MHLKPLALALVAVLLLLIVAAALLMTASRRRKDWIRRVESVIDGQRAAKLESPAVLPMLWRRVLAHPAFGRVATILGMDLGRLDEYSLRWFIVLGATLLAARLAGGVVADALSDALVLPVTVVVFVLLSRSIFAMLEKRRREKLFRQFPDALAQITRAVRVGIPVVEAIRQVAAEAQAPTGGEFQAIADRLVLGVPLDEALADTAMRTGVPEYRFFATALALQARTGGGLAETLDNLAEVIRKRVALRERGYALASEARTSALILASLPFFTCGLLFVVNPSYAALLLTTQNGKIALAAAAGMLTMGMLTMRFIIRRALSS
ncbi:type II secretion system F family protein [Muricoccus radiodurans]|uniref:type II secretion system F family protein n=1 Tax=Muricoccus radiodurans TaxID=2231721 RepID=UPI003CF08555